VINALFVSALGLLFALLLRWACKTLPREDWQIVATLPLEKDASGHWAGINLTYYGVITASAGVIAILAFLMLMASIHAPLLAALVAVLGILLCCLPAARFVARVVEGRRYGFTVAGAVFIGLLIAPLVVLGINSLARVEGQLSPIGPTVAALAIAYTLGEGVGRLACISFGCCYGKPVAAVSPTARRVFERFSFAFHGETKKIAYASGMQGVKVVPIQALTAALYVGAGLTAVYLFLEGFYAVAYALTIVVSQGWRVYSETLRADYRGEGKVSAYQKMAAAGMLYALAILAVLPTDISALPDLAVGIAALWDPVVIVAVQVIWVVVFLYTGWSMVTGSTLTFHVHRDRV
jgi:hypothetical protein